MTHATPTDPQALRDEIAATRHDLGETMEALAAKADVKARAKDAVGHASDQAKEKITQASDQVKEKIGAVRDQAVELAANVGGRVRSSAVSVRDSVQDVDVPTAVRRPLPAAAIAATALALVGVVIYLVRRRRS